MEENGGEGEGVLRCEESSVTRGMGSEGKGETSFRK